MPEAAPPAPSMGLFARFFGVIFSPGPTMAAALRPPAPFGILFLCAIVMGLGTALPLMTDAGKQAYVDTLVQQREAMGQQVTDQTYATLETVARYSPLTSLIGPFIGLPIMTLFFAALFWGIFNAILGGTATYKEVLSVVAHGLVVVAVLQVLGAPIIMMQGKMSMTGPFNLGALVPMLDRTTFLARYLQALTVGGIWQTVVVAIGLATLYKRKTGPIAVGLLAAMLAFTAVMVSVFGRFMGGS